MPAIVSAAQNAFACNTACALSPGGRTIDVPLRAAARGTEPSLKVLVLIGVRFYSELIRTVVQAAVIGSAFVVSTISDAEKVMKHGPVDVLVTDVMVSDGGVLDRLPGWTASRGPALRTLVTTAHGEIPVLDALSKLRIEGVFDQITGSPEEFARAFGAVLAGNRYCSPALSDRLVRDRLDSKSVFRLLTDTERMVLGVIGDGCDNAAAARILPLTESTIRTVRDSLHEKLNVQHKGQLVMRAAEYGFVVRTPFGVLRPGLATLIDAHRHSARAKLRHLSQCQVGVASLV